MIAGNEIPDIPEYLEPGSIRVHAPSLVVFVCGGKIAGAGPPVSVRDAFMRELRKTPLSRYEVYLAEDPDIFEPIGEYTELLRFEANIAQITELLVLFCESAGSMVELGMFVMDDEASPKLLVVIDDKNYSRPSFIKFGPLFSLSRNYGDAAVCVIALAELGMVDISRTENIDTDNLLRILAGPLTKRLQDKREPRTFDRSRHGHVTKLVVGLIQHYAALTLDELETLLYCLDVPVKRDDLRKHLQCAERFGWLRLKRVGIDTYCAATNRAALQAIDFSIKPGSSVRDRLRIRSEIREYWKKSDPTRFKIISDAMAGR